MWLQTGVCAWRMVSRHFHLIFSSYEGGSPPSAGQPSKAGSPTPCPIQSCLLAKKVSVNYVEILSWSEHLLNRAKNGNNKGVKGIDGCRYRVINKKSRRRDESLDSGTLQSSTFWCQPWFKCQVCPWSHVLPENSPVADTASAVPAPIAAQVSFLLPAGVLFLLSQPLQV